MSNKKNLIRSMFIEMPAFADENKDKFHDDELKKIKGNFVKTEKVNQDIEADIYKVNQKNYYKIMFRQNQQLIGMVELDRNTNPVVLFPTLIGIAVRVPYRGKGYSKTFYSWLISYFGGIISDETLTGEEGHGSFQLWQWISKTYPTYFWKSKEKALIPIIGGITDQMMNNKKDHFLASRQPVDHKSYNAKFAPQFNKPELKPVGAMTEMPIFQDKHMSMGKKGKHDDENNQAAYSVAGELVSRNQFNGYIIELFQNESKFEVYALKGKEIVGILSAREFSDFPKVESIFVFENHQGKGLGIQMYKSLIDFAGGVYSDRTLTGEEGGGSFAAWQKLGTMYHAYLNQRIKGSNSSEIIPVKGFHPDMMKSENDRFLVTVKPLNVGQDKENPVDADQYAKMTEMPQFSDKDKELADHESFEPPMYAKLKKSYPIQLPGGSKGVIDLYQFDANPASKEIILKLDTGEGVAVMQFDAPEESDLPFPTVLFAGVKDTHRGKGLSKSLYDFVIKMYKGIISDATLTGEEGYGSFHTWQSLAKTYNAYIVGDNDVVTPRNGFTKDAMGSHHERFMATQYPFDYAKHNEKRQKAYTEVELMQHKAANDIDSSDPNEWDFVSGQKIIEKKVGNGIVFIKMKIPHANDVKYALKDTKTNKIISGMRATIDPRDYKVEPTEAQINSVVTGEQYRNKGWGKLLYKLVLEAEKTIVSDYQLYPGAAAIWNKYLPTIANVYNLSETRGLEPFDFAKGASKAGIYDYFVASTKKLL